MFGHVVVAVDIVVYVGAYRNIGVHREISGGLRFRAWAGQQGSERRS